MDRLPWSGWHWLVGGALGYWIAARLMAFAALTELIFGVQAEQASLEEVAPPLSAEAASG